MGSLVKISTLYGSYLWVIATDISNLVAIQKKTLHSFCFFFPKQNSFLHLTAVLKVNS
jgi:hypothetical protein